MTSRLSDRDRLLAAGCLLGDLVREAELAAAVEAVRRQGNRSLADELKSRGLLKPAEIDFFDGYLRDLQERAPAGRPLDLRSMADEQVAHAAVQTNSASLLEALLVVEPGGARQWRAAAVGFQLLRVIGEGGIGRVWLARDERLQRDVAVKEIRSDRTDALALRERFLREARISAQLQHPNIASCYVVGETALEHAPFLAMELVSGTTFQQCIEESKSSNPTPVAQRARLREQLNILLKICDAIAYAHSRGVIHRDLKPANIMIGKFGEVFVLDWGLARQHSSENLPADGADTENSNELKDSGLSSLTKSGRILGSLPYMAPEQAIGDNRRVGPAADIYGLGAILFAVLTGRPPHTVPKGTPFIEIANQIATNPTPVANECGNHVPPALSAICSKAMDRQPEDRYPNATLLAEDLRAWLAGESIAVFPEPMPQRIARWLVNRPWFVRPLLGILVGGTVILTAVLFFSIFEYQTRAGRAINNLRAAADLIVGRIDDQATELRTDALSLADSVQAAIEGIESDPQRKTRVAELLRKFLDHHPKCLRAQAFDPEPSGAFAAVLRQDGAIRDAVPNNPFPAPSLPNFAEVEPGKVRIEMIEVEPTADKARVVVRTLARTDHPNADTKSGAVRIMIDVDFGPVLRAAVEPVMKETGISVYVADERATIILQGDFISAANTKIGRFGDFAASGPEVDRFLRDSSSQNVGVFGGSGDDRNIIVSRKVYLNPPANPPLLGVVLVVSHRQFIAVPLQTTLWMAIAVAVVFAFGAMVALITIHAIVRLARAN